MDDDFLTTVTREEIFRLGQAHGSFSLGAIDQGIHIVLPTTNLERTESENDIFVPLFNDYFDRIHNIEAIDPDDIGEVYMGAIEKFALDNHLDIGITCHIEDFEKRA